MQCSIGLLPTEAISRKAEAQQREAATACNFPPHFVEMTQFPAVLSLLTCHPSHFARPDNEVNLGGKCNDQNKTPSSDHIKSQ